MIVKPEEMDFSGRKIAMIVAGVPGIGKTTLALSAPKPLLIDLDDGVSRVEAKYRTDTLVVKTFEELKKEIAEEDLSAYETIVLDTGGKLFELIKPSIIRESPKNGKSDGTLSLAGYGIAKKRFSEFVSQVKALGKNLVVVFHASEVTIDPVDKTTGLRIRIEGSTKDEIWDDMDLGGFLEMKGTRRTIGFSNCERYFAKGTRGIHGVWQVPELGPDKPNDFLTRLFAQYNALSAAEVAQNAEEQEAYEAAMAEGREIVAGITDADSANAAMPKIKAVNHALTSKKEVNAAFNAKIKELGLFYDKVLKKYTPAPAAPGEEKGAE